jgi:hypothetical protein
MAVEVWNLGLMIEREELQVVVLISADTLLEDRKKGTVERT